MIHMTVKTTDSGSKEMKEFVKMLGRYKTAFVSVGIHEGAGEYTGGSGDQPSVVEVALWNEFGTKKIPERSWMRSAIDEHIGLINSWREEAIEKIIKGTWKPDQALEAIGLRLQILLQNSIRSNIPPENAPSTLEKKRRDGAPLQTLIHTWLMFRSVTYKVHTSGEIGEEEAT